MVYLLNMVIFHGYVSHNQMVGHTQIVHAQYGMVRIKDKKTSVDGSMMASKSWCLGQLAHADDVELACV